MPKKILAIGELLADLITDDYVSDLSETRALRLFQGGSPANLCANLRYLGVEANLIATVGADGIGDLLIQQLKNINVDTSYIQRTAKFPTSLVLVGKSKGTPDFIAYRLADTHIHTIDPTGLQDAALVHTTAFALSKGPARDTILNALDTAFARGLAVSVDWNFSERIWAPDNGHREFERICAMKPLLKCSLDDVTRFRGEDADATAAMNFLGQYQTKITCLTCGKDGVWANLDGNGDWHHFAAPQVHQVADTTGAGDAFWAGFLSEWVEDAGFEKSIQKGLAVAAAKIQRQGPLYASLES